MDNSESLFFANSPEAMLVIDTNTGQILLANQKARELLHENKHGHSITNKDIKFF